MNEHAVVLSQLLLSTSVSTTVATTANLDTLWTTIITFLVSVITIVGGELIKFLVAFLKKKTDNLVKKNAKINEETQTKEK